MMTRKPGWEDRLAEVVEKHCSLLSEYGTSDCYQMCDEAVMACLGERMHGEMTGYTTAAGAAKLMRKHGIETVEDAFRVRFEEIPPSLARRGDLGVFDHNGEVVGGFFTSIGLLVPTENGKVFLPVSQVRTAFRVI